MVNTINCTAYQQGLQAYSRLFREHFEEMLLFTAHPGRAVNVTICAPCRIAFGDGRANLAHILFGGAPQGAGCPMNSNEEMVTFLHVLLACSIMISFTSLCDCANVRVLWKSAEIPQQFIIIFIHAEVVQNE